MTAGKRDRPRHFAERRSMTAATGWIDAHSRPLGPETVSLDEAVGRVLAEDIAAALDVPPFDRAATDGYALRAAETVGAGSYNPALFRLAETAGVPDRTGVFAGIALRVATGAALPAGTDAVVAAEHAQESGDGMVEIIDAVAPGDNVERCGAHIRRGAALLPSGRILGPADVGALAATGVARVAVVRRPRLRLLRLAGDGASPVDDADGPLLRALVSRDGGAIIDERRIGRERAAIDEALAAVPDADVMLVTGGTGFGDNDHAAAALAAIGELAMHGLALRPGGSLGIGRLGTALVFLLPGAPSACLWAYELVAGRAVRRLGGRDAGLPYAVRRLIATRKIVSSIGFAQICPVRRLGEDRVEPTASFDEAGLLAATRADGFVLVPEGSEGFAEGATVDVYLPVA